jgi:tRNA (cmo5U34)-methyltransferase
VVFGKVYQSLKPGGSFWISDLVSHETDEMTEFFEEQYAIFLEKTGGAAYRETVMAHIEDEDTPRPVTYQLQLLKNAGFRFVELLHKNARFAAFGGIK